MLEDKKLQKSRKVSEKTQVKNIKGGIVCCRGSGRRCICFVRSSGVPSKFWKSVFHFDDVEQNDKKEDRLR